MKTLVTGGAGFIGSELIADLLARGFAVKATTRKVNPSLSFHERLEWIEIDSIDSRTDWTTALRDVESVVHLAARAHVLRESHANPEHAFLETNYEGTKCLANASRGRVRRFVYLSSIGVHGAANGQSAFSEFSAIQPVAAYARSKARAESYLQALTSQGDLDCAILRPPLVYGRNAPGNIARLTKMVRRGLPLPLASIDNRRSLVSVGYLARAIVVLLEAQAVSRPAYVIADRHAVSTADMIRAIARGLDCSPRLWSLPQEMLIGMGAISRRRKIIEQLIGNLEVDASNFRYEFGDLQRCTTVQGLTDMARATRA